ncbi:MAG: S9 family peptidase [Ilumatobacter sp.]|nr:S9 family peptidase [Ilumatobacter sp.]
MFDDDDRPASPTERTASPPPDPPPDPPVAARRPHVWERPTGPVDDPYAWMRVTDDPAFVEYLLAENAYADTFFGAHRDLVETLFQEIRSRVQETDMSTPVRNGDWWYVSSTEEGHSYPRHHRGPTRDDATATLLLDENVEAEGFEYFDLGAFDASHDHTAIAWSMDTAGDERYTLRIRRFGADGSFADTADVIDDVANAGTAWSADGRSLFYVRADAQERPFQVWRHTVGAAPADGDDELVFEEPDERFYVAVGETRSDEWIFVHVASKTSSEVRMMPSDLSAPLRAVAARRDGIEYYVDHWGDRFVVTTNDGALDFRVLAAPVADAFGTLGSAPDVWTELVPQVPGHRIVGVEAFADHLVVHEWADAQPRLRMLFRDSSVPARSVELGPDPHDVELSSNPEWTSDTIRFYTQSMTTPPTLYDEAVVTAERELLKRVPTPNVDLDAYRTQRTWATSSDGTLVPLDFVHHADTPLDGTAPGVIYGYGAYEASLPPWFSVARLSLLDRGFVFALAHPRGGGELGRQWYFDGKLEAKQHTFDDVIGCAEHLIASGVVAAGRLAVRGGSAGGLLVGACITQRPDLFAGAIAEVPFVDIVSTMSDPSLPLTVTEWEEWGDPRSEPFASVMAAYSPYDNTVEADYPAVYATAGLNDPRVSVHEPAKWVARLRAATTSGRPIVLRTELGAGHGGPTGRYEAWRDEARTLAFLLTTV